MIVLGVETTAHTFGIGIIRINNKEGGRRVLDGEILANVKDSYKTESGGIIPVEAAKHHEIVKDEVLERAINKAGIKLQDVDVVAFSQGPGLGPCLRAGARFAASLSFKLKKPLVGVNHCIAHLEVGSLVSDVKDPILLYVSGANTQVIAYEAGKYRIFGETLDMGVGNFLDAFARELGIGFPGGPKIEKFALKGKKFVELPYVVKGMDISVSGLLTNLKNKIKLIRDNKVDYSIEDLCFSVQETVFSMLLEVTERAVFHCDKKEVLLGGGVGCNTRLKEMIKTMAAENKLKVFIPENSLLTDNGVMIAWLGAKMFAANPKKYSYVDSHDKVVDVVIKPYERTDDVVVDWK